MRFRPIHDHVLLRRRESAGWTASAIIIPDSVRGSPREAEVVAIGSSERGKNVAEHFRVEIEDCALVGKWAGTEAEIDATEYLIVTENDTLSVIEIIDVATQAA